MNNQNAGNMVRKHTINYQAAACATFCTFILFAFHAGIKGYGLQSIKEYHDDYVEDKGDGYDEIVDHMYLNYAVAVGVAGSSIFYGLFLVMELHTALFLRVVLLASSMVLYLGSVADGKADGGVSKNMEDAFEGFDEHDWSAVSMALAWVFIAGFELNQSFYKHCGRVTSKMFVFFFYALVTCSALIKGFTLMSENLENTPSCSFFREPSDRVDFCTYNPNTAGKIVLTAGIFAALATVAFLFYVCLDHSEPIKLHMIFSVLMVLTYFGYVGYEYHHQMEMISNTRAAVDDKWEYIDRIGRFYDSNQKTKEYVFLGFFEEVMHYGLASDIFEVLAVLSMVGFNAYFLETQKVSQEDLAGIVAV